MVATGLTNSNLSKKGQLDNPVSDVADAIQQQVCHTKSLWMAKVESEFTQASRSNNLEKTWRKLNYVNFIRMLPAKSTMWMF